MKNRDVTLSKHFKLEEFLHLDKYPENIPSVQDVVNMTCWAQRGLSPLHPLPAPAHFEALAGDLRVRITLLSAQKEPSLLCLCKRSDRKTRNNPRFSC